MRQLSQFCLVMLTLLSVAGCTSLRYYSQAIGGQLRLMVSGAPISDLLADPELAPALREQLHTAIAAREFAGDWLALPVDGSFARYIELDRPYVVVNLTAVPEFSLTPHQWCYPVIGCQSYRGYFDTADARREQAHFEARNYDTLLGGVTAYSTLGWFDDPLHSGFTNLPSARMVALLFHELSHRVVYVAGDTVFNESFATAVELEGLRLWLAQHGEQAEFEQALRRLRHRDQTLALVNNASDQLSELYRQAGQRPVAELRAAKQQILQRLQEDYQALSVDWPEAGPLGREPADLNNAHLALLRQYHQFVPAFRQLLQDHNYDFPAFYRSVKELARLPPDRRQRRLARLAQRFDEHL
ncbi:aminopeptidase [Marinobacter sp. SS21]|uniref:aminopeptidase n=1 Tax=Marinobacter sp. SS21 TaxID=2979460 RepID=UPI00232EED4A|nr:aminopeptidase [Marinobacter sp. SS21]MDC0662271.1 aminopeptidase [Marinobacter sp. SS21]